MRIVMIYNVTDGYTFTCTETVPIEYESTESAIVDFEAILLKTKMENLRNDVFTFAGECFHVSDFYYMQDKYNLPEFMTVDDWFAGHAKNI